jgi:divalent metal cation (Fe/Co/Zn/Cd) transporter
VRAAVGLLGLAGIAVGVSALTKLGSSHLDSPRWLFVVAGAVSIVAGLGLLVYALRGLPLKPRNRRTRR